MSDKEFVKSQRPDAEAHFTEATKEMGRKDPMWPAHWDIYDGPRHHGQNPLGTGDTEALAWKDAADKLRSSEPIQ